MPANFNNSAWFYDRLSRLVYGRALVDAQVYLLKYIPANTSVLVVGGGTGWILEEIAKIYPSGLTITYVEVAKNMMALSRKRNSSGNEVEFVNEAIENLNLQTKFDVVITPFLFDNFKDETVQKVFGHIHTLLKPNALWLNCDFQLSGKLWQWVLLKLMFLFFRIVCGIEAYQLPAIDKHFEQYGYMAVEKGAFFDDFITSEVYKRL